VSRLQYQVLSKYLDNIKGKEVIIYNPPPTLPHMKKKYSYEPLFIFPGDTGYVKGFAVLLQALPEILTETNAEIYITGGRSINPHLFKKLKYLNLKFSKMSRIIILHGMSYEDYLGLHKEAWPLLSIYVNRTSSICYY